MALNSFTIARYFFSFKDSKQQVSYLTLVPQARLQEVIQCAVCSGQEKGDMEFAVCVCVCVYESHTHTHTHIHTCTHTYTNVHIQQHTIFLHPPRLCKQYESEID